MKGGMKVDYKGGESRQHPGTSVDFMLVRFEDQELYAELPFAFDADGNWLEDGNYEALKASILEQAEYWGINPACLEFWWD